MSHNVSTFISSVLPGVANKWMVKCETSKSRCQCRRGDVQMLRVQKKRRPEDWEKKMSTLSGRFLPMDPRDEAVLDVLENGVARIEEKELYGPDGVRSEAFEELTRGNAKKWSKRSEAARKRWADPAYRAKVLAKRAEKRERDAAEQPKQHKVEIGKMDSITLCDDNKAKAINDYARSNKLRSEKITAYHQNRRLWMENRLKDGPGKLSEEDYIKRKKEVQARRRMVALRRAEAARIRRGQEETEEEAKQ